jgi:photosystem II stability/assembly factor-like uncharacterized protein
MLSPIHFVRLAPVFALLATLAQAPPPRVDAGPGRATPAGGPPGGEVLSLTVDSRSPKTLYASVMSAGIFKTVDGGAHWTETGPDVSSSLAMFELAFDPSNPTALYAENLGSFYRTLDGGASWLRVKSVPASLRSWARGDKRSRKVGPWPKGAVGLKEGTIVVREPGKPSTAYAGTTSGILKTTDSGTSWAPANTGLSGGWATVLAVMPGDPPSLLAHRPPAGLYRSTDGGDSWTSIGPPLADTPVFQVSAVPGSPRTLVAPTRDGIYSSADGGASWTALAGNWPEGLSRLAMGPAGSATMYAEAAKGVMKSVDGGVHWTAMTAGLPAKMPMARVVLDQGAPARLYAWAMFERLYRSLDAGATWGPLAELPRRPFRFEVLPDPDSQDVIYIRTVGTYVESSEGDIYRTTDGGNTWTEVAVYASGAVPMDFLAVVSSHPATLFAGVQGRGSEPYALLKSTDRGATWTRSDIGLPPAGPVTSIVADPGNPRMLFAGTGRGVFRSVDGGERWQPTQAK